MPRHMDAFLPLSVLPRPADGRKDSAFDAAGSDSLDECLLAGEKQKENRQHGKSGDSELQRVLPDIRTGCQQGLNTHGERHVVLGGHHNGLPQEVIPDAEKCKNK